MKQQWKKWFVLAMLLPCWAMAQTRYEKQGGNFSLGVRSVMSAFGHGSLKEIGYGAGGSYRIQVIDRVNTDWYADIINTNIEGAAHRTDYHIGWSVMFYVIDPHAFQRKVTPFVEAGHCFDWTHVHILGEGGEHRTKFSSAVHAGAGTHFNITPKFDITLKAQYMWHLGKDLHAEQEEGRWIIEEEASPGWQGHLLISLSFNYKLCKLWKAKK